MDEDPPRLFEVFIKPAAGSSYQLTALERAEVCVLHEMDTSEKSGCVPWGDMLLWFEGKRFMIGKSKAFAEEDEAHLPTAPIFLTGEDLPYHKSPVQRDMAARRVTRYHFTFSIPEHMRKEIPPCAACFSKFILQVELRP